jgi:alpha-galactosidase
MNHRRQENTLLSYAKIKGCFKKAKPDNDIVFSICEWGKTQPQNWGYKVGDSWRILNDITFQVGSDGDRGHASWEGAYTTSVTAQYNRP